MFNLAGYAPFCGWAYGYGGLIMWIIFLVVIGVLVYFLFRGQGRQGSLKNIFGESQDESPIDIAKKRYARGEISREEFEQLRKELE